MNNSSERHPDLIACVEKRLSLIADQMDALPVLPCKEWYAVHKSIEPLIQEAEAIALLTVPDRIDAQLQRLYSRRNVLLRGDANHG